MSLKTVQPIAVALSQNTNRICYYKKVLLLSEHQEDEPNFPVVNILPEYDPDLVMGIGIKAKNVTSILSSFVEVENKDLSIVYIRTKEDNFICYFIFLLTREDHQKFSDFAPKMFPKSKVTAIDSEPGMKILINSGIAFSSIMKCWNELEWMSPPISSYVSYLTSSPISKKDFRKKMASEENLFGVLSGLGWSSSQVIQALLSYISRQKCGFLPSCPRFSKLRCEGCLTVHYCGQICQGKDFTQHKLLCPVLRLQKLRKLQDGVFIEEQLRRRLKVEDLPSFDLFVQLISNKIFEIFAGSLDVPVIRSFIVSNLDTEKSTKIQEEKLWFKYLKKFSQGKGKALSEIEEEFVEHWGPLNSLSKLLHGGDGEKDEVRSGIEKGSASEKGKKIQASKISSKRRKGR